MIAIDLGSNTIRFIEFDGVKWGKSFEKIVRTAESLNTTGKISSKAVERIIQAFREAREILNFTNQEVVGVTTAAIRMASNNKAVLDQIEAETNLRFRVIDGIEEAELTLLAVKNRMNVLKLPTQNFFLADIGGASTEITLVDHNRAISVSLNFGILTMNEKAIHFNITDLLDEFESKIIEFLDAHNSSNIINRLVLTAGTPTTIAAYKKRISYHDYSPEYVNGSLISMDDCLQTLDELTKMDESLCAYYVGVGREGLITTGIMMVQSLFKALKVQEGIVIDDGLREGVALNYFLVSDSPI